jgi:hypothetical protein
MNKNYIQLIIFSLLFSQIAFGQIVTDGLQGYWTFDGNANDLSGNDNHGVVYGATLAEDRFGQPDMAYCFDGVNDYIKTAFSGITGSGSRSVSFWAKISSTGNSINTSGYEFFSYGDNPGTAEGGSFRLVLNRNCNGLGVNVGSAVDITNNSISTLDEWHHYAVVYDQSISGQLNSIEIYLDGVLLSNSYCETYNVSAVLNTQSAQPIHFGRLFLPNDGRFFKGCLDDFYMHDRALSAKEVDSLFNENSVSIETLDLSLELSIYPNPTGNILNIETDSEEIESILIQTLDGKVVYKSKFSKSLDVSSYKPGVYVISFKDKKKNRVKNLKFTKR